MSALEIVVTAAGCKQTMNNPPAGDWPKSLASIGAIRFAHRSEHFEASVAFFGELIGLPVHETFEQSYGSDGVVFGLPGPALTLEIARSLEPLAADVHEQICLYFPTAE